MTPTPRRGTRPPDAVASRQPKELRRCAMTGRRKRTARCAPRLRRASRAAPSRTSLRIKWHRRRRSRSPRGTLPAGEARRRACAERRAGYQHVEADMNRNLASEDFEEILRSAQPRLIIRVEPANDGTYRLRPFIREIDPGWDEVISEGYDPIHSPLGCPVYWRIVTRATEQLYLSTFLATREVVLKGWGRKGLAYRNRDTGMTPARLETLLSPTAQAAFSTSQIN